VPDETDELVLVGLVVETTVEVVGLAVTVADDELGAGDEPPEAAPAYSGGPGIT
jgi:hypothetical protein